MNRKGERSKELAQVVIPSANVSVFLGKLSPEKKCAFSLTLKFYINVLPEFGEAMIMDNTILLLAFGGSGMMSGGSIILYVILGISSLISWVVSRRLKSKFAKYSQVPIPLTGREIAERMLQENGISDVKVISAPGQLTDHYNPANKTVNLSEVVYNQNNVAAAAVSAHECGHAIQHAKSYAFLTMRSKLVPVVNISSKLMGFVMMISFAAAFLMQNPLMLGVIVIAMGMTTLFAFVTLPVEFDASKRALAWINSSGQADSMGQDQAKDALFWAAMTYVVAALASLAQLLYYVYRLIGSRR